MYILWYKLIKMKTSSNPLVKNEGVPLPWESNKGGVTNQVSDLGHVGYHSTSFNIPFRSGEKCNDESSIFISFVPNWIWWFSHCHVYRRVNQNPSFHYTGHPSVSSQRRWCHAAAVLTRTLEDRPWKDKRNLQQQRSDKVSGTSQTCLVPSAQDKLPPSTPGLVLGLSIFVGPFWRYLDIRY